MRGIELSADELSSALLGLAENEHVCILDSCGVGHLGSHLMIAGVRPVEMFELDFEDANETLLALEKHLSSELAAFFSISYDLGLQINGIASAVPDEEPKVFLALFDRLIVHDYDTGETRLIGDNGRFDEIEKLLMSSELKTDNNAAANNLESNFTRGEYIAAVETIKEYIRSGDTYQTNLTQQFTARLPDDLTPENIFRRLRSQHPSPFSAYLRRKDSTIVSASPERFFRILEGHITASPIKGTRPRGKTSESDEAFRNELLKSEKDRAENTMIVDLLRNDLGRVCEYGTVKVEKLCDIEEHPTLFHLVSTIRGELNGDATFSDILRAVFPCGSITGAPKVRTMKIIDEIEKIKRGLSMGAIGYRLPEAFGTGESIDLNVAIRTMVISNKEVIFNVGGGIVIDSDPQAEYEESVLKAKALLTALGIGATSAQKS
ncbi:MAG: aminodeoxychorismate synthase component I [Blastocatellia bacterium]